MATDGTDKFPDIDFAQSAKKLSDWLQSVKRSEWTPTKEVKELQALAKRLNGIADELWQAKWLSLEAAVDEDPPPVIGFDGWPIPQESRQGRYQVCMSRIREVADIANSKAEEFHNSRARPELKEAATAFLHLWRESGRDRPTMYDKGEAVTAFRNVLERGGYVLSESRARGILETAWKDFDHHLICPLFEQISTWKQ